MTRHDDRVATRDVALGPGLNRTATVSVDLSERGDHRVGVDGFGSLTVSVGSSERGGAGESGDGWFAVGPGFGPAVALLALVGSLCGALLARKRRS